MKRGSKTFGMLLVRKCVGALLVALMLFADVAALLVFTPQLIPSASADAGDFSVFRNESDNTTVASGAGEVEVVWDTVVDENPNLPLVTGSTTIDLVEGGKYLVLYNVWTENVVNQNNNRRSFETYLTLNEVELAYGRGDGYIRDQNGDDNFAYANGAAVIEASAGDDLEINIARDDASAQTAAIRTGTNGCPSLNLKMILITYASLKMLESKILVRILVLPMWCGIITMK